MKFTMHQKKILSQFHEIAGILFMILAIYFFIQIKNFRHNSPISFAVGVVCVVVLWLGGHHMAFHLAPHMTRRSPGVQE